MICLSDQNFSGKFLEFVIHYFVCLKNFLVPSLIYYAMKNSMLVFPDLEMKKKLKQFESKQNDVKRKYSVFISYNFLMNPSFTARLYTITKRSLIKIIKIT